MHKGDPAASRPATWNLVYQTVSRCPASLECRVEIGNPVADVVNPGASLRQELSNGSVGVERREQLHFRVSHRQREDGGAIDCFRRMRHQAKDVRVKGDCRFQVGDGNSDMRDAGEIGHWSLPMS
jgi:hypothetical protein